MRQQVTAVTTAMAVTLAAFSTLGLTVKGEAKFEQDTLTKVIDAPRRN